MQDLLTPLELKEFVLDTYAETDSAGHRVESQLK